MKSFHFALVFSIAIHLMALLLLQDQTQVSVFKDQGHQGVLTITLATKEPTVERLDDASIHFNIDAANPFQNALNMLQTPTPGQKIANNPGDKNASASSANTPRESAGHTSRADVAGDQEIESIGIKDTQERHQTPIKRVHPANWLAFMVVISPEGVITEYRQISKGDPNTSLYVILENEIREMKVPESMFGRKILVSGPPLRIETDPALLAEYF